MKYIFELILSTIIIFFVWNVLKRIFFNAFYKKMGIRPNSQPKEEYKNSSTEKKKKVNWDAETVDYEEVKDK